MTITYEVCWPLTSLSFLACFSVLVFPKLQTYSEVESRGGHHAASAVASALPACLPLSGMY